MEKLKLKKLISCFMAGAMVVSMAACGNANGEGPTITATPTPAPKITATPTPKPVENTVTKAPVPTEAPKEVSVNFEDGNSAFAAVYTKGGNAAKVSLAIADFSGSKALEVTNENGKIPYVAFDLSGLLGENVSKVATVEMTLGTTHPDGKFYATSGEVTFWAGAELAEHKESWSVYMETKNPKVATVKVGDVALTSDNNIMIISLKTDNGSAAGAATLYIDNLRFLDAAGNLLTADSSVAFTGPAGFADTKIDRTNLVNLGNTVEFAGFAVNGGAWSQNGLDMTQEFLDALVPGSTIEVEYTSGDGNIWFVFPDAAAGWSRVGDGSWAGNSHSEVYMNGTRTIAQLDYDQIVEVCGEDKSTWGARLQCEGSSDWEVYSVKVGAFEKAGKKEFVPSIEFAGFATKGSGWGQDGFDFTQEVLDALVPGTALELSFTSEDGTLWIVLPDAAAGWSRVGDGDYCGNGHEAAVVEDGKCYVTYEQIVALCGEDKTTWGARLQAEARSAWEVYAVNVGTLVEKPTAPRLHNYKVFEGFATKGSGWGQDGFDFTQEVLDALVPGSVLEISYTSEDGTLWIVLPDAAAGWSRVGDGDYCGNGHSAAVLLDGKCYVTYEQIAALCGEDKAAWGARLQAEAGSAWEVYSVRVGQTSGTTTAPVVEAPATETPAVEEPVDELASLYVGNYNAHIIPASEFADFANGVTLTFNFDRVKTGYSYWNFTFINNVDGWPKFLDDKYYVGTKPAFSEWDFVDVNDTSVTQYTVTLSADAVAEILSGGGFGIQVYGVVVLDYTLTAIQ